MKLAYRKCLAATVMLAAVGVGAQLQPQPGQAQGQLAKATLSGKVVNALTGEPLRKVSIMLVFAGGRGSEQQVRTAVTDEQGAFSFTGVEPGSYRLIAVRTGFVRQAYGDGDAGAYIRSGSAVNVNPGQELKDILLRLQPAAAISGRVVDQEGDPLMHVRVQALRWNYFGGRRQLMPGGTGQSDDHGEYRIYNLNPGRYYLSATYDGGYFVGYMAGIGADITEQALTDKTYAPVFYPGVNDPAQAAPVVVRGGEEVPGINFMIAPQRAVAISGRVFNSVTGQAGRNVHVALLGRSLAMRAFISGDHDTVTDEQGTFRFRGIAPGSYIVVAEWDGEGQGPGKVTTSTDTESVTQYNRRHYSGRQFIDVAGADIEGITLVIAPGVDISGTIRVEGTLPPPNPARSERSDTVVMGNRVIRGTTPSQMRVILVSFDDVSVGNLAAVVKPDNSFVLENVPEGTYRMNVAGVPGNAYLKSVRIGGQDVLEDGLVVARGRRGALELVISTLTGHVEGAALDEGGKPFAGARVALVPEGARRNMPNLYRIATSDQSGRFAFASLPPGDYKLFAWDAIESGAYQDPDFLRPFEDRGQVVRVTESGQSTAEIKVIITEERGAH